MHNHDDLIAGALDAIAAQTSTADEVIVVDDGSPAEAAARIAAIVAGHPAARLLRQEENRVVRPVSPIGGRRRLRRLASRRG